MNGHGGIVTFFIFLFLSIVILLQVLSMVQSDRLYERINRLDETFKNAASVRSTKGKRDVSTVIDEEYPGDEGDWLVWRLGAEPATLNPITAKDLYASWVTSGSIFESLLEYDLDKVVLKPLLAESYEVSSSGLEMTFRLRGDVHFSDGVAVTVDDIIFTYETVMNRGVDAARMANYFRDIERVVKIDERVVKFVMRKPYFKSLEMVGGMPILPKHIYEFADPEEFNKHRSNLVGSGPYVFEKWDVGRKIVLQRNERYWGKRPKLDKIVYRIITNEVAALQALRSYDIDFMRPDPEQFADCSGDEEFIDKFYCLKYWTPGDGYRYIGWNQAKPFFKDRRVRLAMTHLVDRELIIKHLLKGLGRIITGPFYVFGPQNDPTIEPWSYNPERAKELLDEAGWVDSDGDGVRDKNGVPFQFNFMIVSQFPFHERLAKLLKDEAAKVGIELIPDPYEWSVFIERINTRSFDAVTLAWTGAIQEDPYQIWHSSQIENRGSNAVGFRNAEADAIIEKARQTMNAEQRNKLYHRFHQILHKEQPYTFLLSRPSMRFLDRRFENVKIHKLGLDGEEWYVPKDQQRYK